MFKLFRQFRMYFTGIFPYHLRGRNSIFEFDILRDIRFCQVFSDSIDYSWPFLICSCSLFPHLTLLKKSC